MQSARPRCLCTAAPLARSPALTWARSRLCCRFPLLPCATPASASSSKLQQSWGTGTRRGCIWQLSHVALCAMKQRISRTGACARRSERKREWRGEGTARRPKFCEFDRAVLLIDKGRPNCRGDRPECQTVRKAGPGERGRRRRSHYQDPPVHLSELAAVRCVWQPPTEQATAAATCASAWRPACSRDCTAPAAADTSAAWRQRRDCTAPAAAASAAWRQRWRQAKPTAAAVCRAGCSRPLPTWRLARRHQPLRCARTRTRGSASAIARQHTVDAPPCCRCWPGAARPAA